MKNINRIIALLLISLLGIGNTFATGFPDEPMIIYGNISGVNMDGKTLNITDSTGDIKVSSIIGSSTYGTNKTFDLTKKISLNTFDGELKFSSIGYIFKGINIGETNTCEASSTFQKGNICQYNLEFSRISSGGGGSGGGGGNSRSSGGSSGSSSYDTIKTDISTPDTSSDSETKESGTESSEDTNESKGSAVNPNVKRNEEGKIIIKGSDYIKTLKAFNANKKEEKSLFGHKVLSIKNNSSYSKSVETNMKNIIKNIKLDSIRGSMVKYLDRMTISYGIFTDETIDEELREIYKEKLRDDKAYFDLKLKKLKRKDEIIRYVFEKRKQKSSK